MKKNYFAVLQMKKLLPIGIILLFIVLLIANPSLAIESVKTGLGLCANILIPSLFPFFVLSGLLIQLGFARMLSRPLQYIMGPLFGVSGSGSLAFVLGIVSGYPLGASCACELYENGACNKQESERLLAFCNNSGPLFIIGSVGAAMYHSQIVGIALYVTHILAAITVGILFHFFFRNNHAVYPSTPSILSKPAHNSFGELLSSVMRRSIQNMLLICGFTLIFSVIIRFALLPFPEGGFSNLMAGLLEITMGLFRTASSSLPLGTKLICSAAILGFAGFSVHFQVIGIVSKTDLSIRPYLIGKSLQAIIAALYFWLTLPFLPLDITAFAPLSPLASPALMIDFKTAIRLSIAYLCVALAAVAAMFAVAGIHHFWSKIIDRVKRR